MVLYISPSTTPIAARVCPDSVDPTPGGTTPPAEANCVSQILNPVKPVAPYGFGYKNWVTASFGSPHNLAFDVSLNKATGVITYTLIAPNLEERDRYFALDSGQSRRVYLNNRNYTFSRTTDPTRADTELSVCC